MKAQKMFDDLSSLFRDKMEEKGYIPMTLFLSDAGIDNAVGCFPFPSALQKDKDMLAAFIRSLIAKEQPDSILLVMEAWASEIKDGVEYANASEDPNRTEVLYVYGESLTEKLAWKATVTRTPTCLAVVSPFVPVAPEDISGRFADLYPQKEAVAPEVPQ